MEVIVSSSTAIASQLWSRALLYEFPPVPLIPCLLGRIQDENLVVILVVPESASMSCHSLMMQSSNSW